ncbi:MAG: DUF5719 family protein [Acidimicrobiales bacterium]
MSRTRIPVIVVIVGLLVAAVVVERDRDVATVATAGNDLSRVAPVVADDSVLGDTWYCAAGSSDDDGPADHTVVVSNTTSEPRAVTLTAFPGRADPVTLDSVVDADTVERVAISDLVEAPAVAVMVESDGGGIVVHHDLAGPTGRDVAPCASSSSDVWHFAWGDTSRDARSLIALFNPFPGDAVVDVQVVSVEGVRQPGALTGVVVPGGSVVVTDIGAEVTRRDQVSTTVTARSGRIVAERMQVFDDTEEMLDGADPRRGLAVDLGASVPVETWAFPGVRFTEGLDERIIVYNPGDGTAEVDVEVLVPSATGGVEPFALTVRPNGYEVLDLSGQSRILDLVEEGAVPATVIVRSLNAAPVVAERVTTVPTSAEGAGISSSSGSVLIGTELVVVDPLPSGAVAADLVLVNLDGDSLVSGTISVHARGVRRTLDGFDRFEIGPAGRVSIDVTGPVSASALSTLVVEASGPVAAELVVRVDGPDDRMSWPGLALMGSAGFPPGLG